MDTHIVIMAGGVGSRLYPLSTPERPKQFLDLLDCGKTLIQLTYERFLALDPNAHFWVVTSAQYIHFIHELLPQIPAEQILAEPAARNTAPCIAYACRKIAKKYPNAHVVVTPSDAYVPDNEAFAKTLQTALNFTVGKESIVCLGIQPTFPSCEYGYIKEIPGNLLEENGECVRKVDAFKEKPTTEVAESYLAQGGYWWNAGIFIWNIQTVEKQLRAFVPQIAEMMDKMEDAFYTESETEFVEKYFPQCEKISIDYALMEKSPDIYMSPCNWSWSDLGSFEAIEKVKSER